MGRVFEFDEIKAGKIPNASSFSLVTQTFMDAVSHEVGRGTVEGAMIYGSTAISRTTTRSDFDCLVMMSSDDNSNYESARHIAQSIGRATDWTVPVSMIAYSQSVLAGSRHEIDRFFGQHLTGPNRIVAESDPAMFMRFSDDPGTLIFRNYLRNKKRRITTGYLEHDTSERLKGLQRMLELPAAIGRKALRLIDEVEGTQRSSANSADKVAVMSAASKLYEEMGVGDGASWIRQLDNAYEGYLSEAISGTVSEANYNAFLDDVIEQMPQSVAWLDEVDSAIQNRLGGLV